MFFEFTASQIDCTARNERPIAVCVSSSVNCRTLHHREQNAFPVTKHHVIARQRDDLHERTRIREKSHADSFDRIIRGRDVVIFFPACSQAHFVIHIETYVAIICVIHFVRSGLVFFFRARSGLSHLFLSTCVLCILNYIFSHQSIG